MTCSTINRYLCDLCSQKAADTETNLLPTGWVKVVIESRYLDRDFTDKHVCLHCVAEIAREAAK